MKRTNLIMGILYTVLAVALLITGTLSAIKGYYLGGFMLCLGVFFLWRAFREFREYRKQI